MSRTARFLKDGGCYYIASRGFQGQKIFNAGEDYMQYLELLRKYRLRYRSSVYAYCLVPKAIHLIVHPGDVSRLPLFMQGLHQSYALYFNNKYQKAGKVWGQRYKSNLLKEDQDLIECIKWIEFIPVRERLSQSPVEYAWSSCANRVLGSGGVVDSMPPGVLLRRD